MPGLHRDAGAMENSAGKDVHPSNGKAAVMDRSIAHVGALMR